MDGLNWWIAWLVGWLASTSEHSTVCVYEFEKVHMCIYILTSNIMGYYALPTASPNFWIINSITVSLRICLRKNTKTHLYNLPNPKGNPEILTMISFLTVTKAFSKINPESSLHGWLVHVACEIPSWELTYPTIAKGNSSSKVLFGGDILVSLRVF